MGLFSRIFSGGRGKIAKAASSVSFLQTYSGGSAGWGLSRFRSIIDAHSSIEDMVEEWGLDAEDSTYMSPDGYPNCYTQAYEEEYERASVMADMMSALTGGLIHFDPEDFMDYERIEMNAYEYACQLADNWYSGAEWIPEEIMDWAWYDLSDHNY